MIRNGIIIIGGHVQGLGIIRIFGKMGIPCILLDTTFINIARHSKYCLKFYKYNPSKLFELLIELSNDSKYKNWLIIPTHDKQVEVLSKNKNELEKYYKVSTDSWGIVEHFYNKRLSYKLAKEINIDIPDTWFPSSIQDIEKLNIQFPCIIKPAIVENFFQKTHKKVYMCRNRDELISNYKLAIEIIPKKEIIVQDIVPGTSENQYSACFFCSNGNPVTQLVAKRKRQHPIDFGNATTFAETVKNDVILRNATKLLKYIKYTGICEVEFKFDYRDNKYKFLEVNPRTWKWHAISEKSGSPFLISLYNLIYSKKPIIKLTWNNAAFKHLTTDLPIMFKLLLKGKFKKSNNKNIQYAVWDKEDLKPAIFELLYLPYLIINR